MSTRKNRRLCVRLREKGQAARNAVPSQPRGNKSQGSEYPAVVIPLRTQHYPVLQRNLVYTGVTRGKRLVVLVGQRKALAIAVKGARTRRRWSKLRDWLIDGGGPIHRAARPAR